MSSKKKEKEAPPPPPPDYLGEKELFRLLKSPDPKKGFAMDAINKLFSEETQPPVDVNWRPEETPNESAIKIAINANKMDLIELLLSKGADVNAKEEETGRTLIQQMIVAKKNDVLNAMLKRNPHLELTDAQGKTALSLALELKNKDACKALFSAGAHLEISTRNPETNENELERCVREGALDLLDLYIDMGAASADATNPSTGDSLLHLAASSGHVNIIQRLYTANAVITENKNADSPMDIAVDVAVPNWDVVTALLAKSTPSLFVRRSEVSPDRPPLLFRLASEGRAETVKRIVTQHMPSPPPAEFIADARDSFGNSLLHACCVASSPDAECLNFFLSPAGGKVSPLAVNQNGDTPLHRACDEGNVPIVEALVASMTAPKVVEPPPVDPKAKKPDPKKKPAVEEPPPPPPEPEKLVDIYNTVEGQQRTALHMAAARGLGSEVIIPLLVNNGMNVEAAEGGGPSQAAPAASVEGEGEVEGEQPVVQEEAAAVVGRTPLQLAVDYAHPETAVVLIRECKANAVKPHPRFTTLIHQVVFEKYSNTLEAMIESVAEQKVHPMMDAFDDNGRTPLHLAVEQSSLECARYLVLNGGANVELPDQYTGYTPLMHASALNRDEMARCLIQECGANVQAFDGKEEATSLIYAARYGSLNAAAVLLENGANVNASDDKKRTALHEAAWRGFSELTQLLVNGGASIDALDNNGMTALHLAVSSGKADVTAILIAAGADVTKRDKQGRTPLLLCAKAGHTSCSSLLMNRAIELKKQGSNSKVSA